MIDLAHNPIILKQQDVKLLHCATLHITKNINGINSHSYEPVEGISSSEILQPKTTAALYHPFQLDEIESALNYCDLNGGCMDGLPCNLEFSSVESFLTTVNTTGSGTTLETVISISNESRFEPGSIVIYETFPVLSKVDENLAGSPFAKLSEMLGLSNPLSAVELMTKISCDESSGGKPWPKEIFPSDLVETTKPMNVLDLNVVLFRCESEDADLINDGLYDIPNFGKLPYGGLSGLIAVLAPACREDNMGHALYENLRKGTWLLDYIISRLKKYINCGYKNLTPFCNWLSERFELLKTLPAPLIPKYFSVIITLSFNAIKNHALFEVQQPKKVTKNPSSFDVFTFSCFLTTFQFYGSVKSAGLIPKPFPLPLMNDTQPLPVESFNGIKIGALAAGLPHFATNYARVWGRDVFIALRGLFIIPGHFEAARSHLIAFASTLKHGLLPNLLDEGRYPRYNARDAVWFWFSAIIDYCNESPEGTAFLNTKVPRRFVPLEKYRQPKSNSPEKIEPDSFQEPNDPLVYKYTSTIAEICHEILERHYSGIEFREWNAGERLDHCMTSPGFNIQISTNQKGYIVGGNIHNCGTWMDKMGDSQPSGNKGVPSTPREGSPIEITGLSKKALSFITDLIQRKDINWPFSKVCNSRGGSLCYKDWNQNLKAHFEEDYYIQKSGYYRDTINASKTLQETQLRPNQVVAMVQVR